MCSLKTFALAGAVMIGATAVASSADLGPPPMGLPTAPYAAPMAEASGWYLRGDIGVGILDGKPEIVDTTGFVSPTVVKGHNPNFGNAGLIGVGVGYQYNSWLRGDITVDYRTKADVKFGDKACSGPGGNVAGTTCAVPTLGATNFFDAYNGKVSSLAVLANGYVDLGTWNGLTPYLGAGVGFASIKASGFTDTGWSQSAAVANAPVFSSYPVYYSDKTKTNFAWAVMAGVGYDVSSNLKLELGYRYLNMGSLNGAAPICPNATCGNVNVAKLDSHEFKLGMRWMLGGPSYAPSQAPAPMAYPVEPRMVKKF
jgi:opacity protein-like surface antigen